MAEDRPIVIRTGCLACRARGIRCSSKDPECKRLTSTTWSSNLSLERRWHGRRNPYQTWCSESTTSIRGLQQTWTGTLRERQSLHFFTVISAAELSGLLDKKFWQVSLLQATHLDGAIKHAVAAIGAFHEHQLRKQACRINAETDTLRLFALRQCNKAISALIKPSRTTDQRHLKSALTASVLFSCFESLTGNRNGAIPHVVYSRKLLEQHRQTCLEYDQTDSLESFPVPVDVIEPLVAHYELQLGELIFENNPSGSTKKFSLSEPPTFRRLADARISLERAVTSLGAVCWSLNTDHTPEDVKTMERQKEEHCSWFRQWDRELSALLARDGNEMDRGILDACRLLKAHQTAAVVLARVAYGKGEGVWAPFVPEFKTVIELISEIFKDAPKKGPTYQVPQTPYFSATIGLTEPLYVAMMRCTDKTVVEEARALLSRLPQNEGVHSSWRIAFIEKTLCAVTGKEYAAPS